MLQTCNWVIWHVCPHGKGSVLPDAQVLLHSLLHQRNWVL